ncbi:unnamed protein product [Mesocestoides corti]|uniref:APP_amyloid domain-containing protein n=1 Tax=Mesocestoides corti TaxID=53468 RepID=A0A0R3U7H3_MESCO|nr:unnamed protein product [Mesocestoides corti]
MEKVEFVDVRKLKVPPSTARGLLIGASIVFGVIAVVIFLICCFCRVRSQNPKVVKTVKMTKMHPCQDNQNVGVDVTDSNLSLDMKVAMDEDARLSGVPGKSVRFYDDDDGGEKHPQSSAPNPLQSGPAIPAKVNLPSYIKIWGEQASNFYSSAAPM